MKPDILVFYAGQLWGEYQHEDVPVLNEALVTNEELFNGSYIFVLEDNTKILGPYHGWYRGNWAPFPEEQVPKELRALLLLYS